MSSSDSTVDEGYTLPDLLVEVENDMTIRTSAPWPGVPLGVVCRRGRRGRQRLDDLRAGHFFVIDANNIALLRTLDEVELSVE